MQLDKKIINHVHCLGIGGIGVSALAEILLKKGCRVTGSDVSPNKNTERLQRLGAEIIFNHDGTAITQADCAVYSSAIGATNPELMAAKQAKIPLLKRGEMLANLMKEYQSIAVAGAHGKTTTSGMLSHAFVEANLDPTFMVGGVLNNSQTPARVGNGHYFIAEADESDASFLFMHPDIAVVTNIDADHLSTYDGDFNRLKQTYIQFLEQTAQDGVVVLCLDDPILREIAPLLSRRVITYGFSSDAQYRVVDYCQQGIQSLFQIHSPQRKAPLTVKLSMPGQHNALNATAVTAIADVVRMNEPALLKSLADFPGVDRRFTIRGEMILPKGNALIIEDYGHHPNEIKATLAAARAAWPERRMVLVFQPHRYSRTRDLMTEFVSVLAETDWLVLLEVYSAGEMPIPGADGMALIKMMSNGMAQKTTFVPLLQNLPETLQKLSQPNDIIILQGAGNIGSIVTALVQTHG
ncbi:UDP-N-acetylmuramate--L-alanine ligase [Coxiella burnetii]|uniref:UDP-N-acetylmuramate--L-alanine ligase n=1 Tax=Coxiella burnetii (strain CbuK_Q154) TaxID=434924 RepID=MURC_COXB1|nr:UDP-N-acetylmuramate--L-alanine ligase [Coxiella burnetii]B6J5K2.1 RecName: Full=UDP-N-acetylmuramate--L-alanine ligase; AltName: Full=UDP-N-acetylmuramoyl-L-alanine synthetase [Coxiella burnetii CbuK_Q154]ACJ21028.1 UDP-N-acetylmuramate--alanine ligase [Coxiella burnetii CbuK_Q154]ATN86620.1 UDP-N-acetylmuramate--alanine ligase [Coxiella burnetii str. Schperling]EAX33461.1 UDP-N-acetylmuramate--L-alanine ligase [Coxiella burnetii 'MSU Goat Q177']EDR36471.1 UDP-N-acetylmuramate--alanine lig